MTTDNPNTKPGEIGLIQCPLCGHKFDRGVKTACTVCPLNYDTCHFEKCPNCGYDIAQGSFLWTAAETAWKNIKHFIKGEKDDGVQGGIDRK